MIFFFFLQFNSPWGPTKRADPVTRRQVGSPAAPLHPELATSDVSQSFRAQSRVTDPCFIKMEKKSAKKGQKA